MGEGRHVFVNVVKPGLKAAQSAGGVSLRGHQEEALEAIVRDLTPHPGHPAPNGLRVTVQMATGSGKSFVWTAPPTSCHSGGPPRPTPRPTCWPPARTPRPPPSCSAS
ncbi:DEAD/DEAH box helicase family protein [Kitasatospora sp. NPDC094028]